MSTARQSRAAQQATTRRIARLRERVRELGRDRIALEEPLEIRFAGKSIAVIMRSPGEDHELAAGFLLTEGLVKRREDIARIAHCRDPKNRDLCNVIDVKPARGVKLAARGWQRSMVSASSCGLCGKLTIASIRREAPPLEDDFQIRAEVIFGLPDKLRHAQESFEETGGIHAAGLFDAEGRLLRVREDIGRHNAVDKVIGAALLEDEIPLSGRILVVSGRASFEILQKALMARIPFVAAVSAASSLAVELAASSRMALVGFLRDRSCNIYAGSERVSS